MTATERPSDRAIAQAFDNFRKETEAVPCGHESVSRGCSTYNWRRHCADVILDAARTLDAAPADCLQQFASDLATRQVDMDPECAGIIAKNFDKLFDAPADPVVSADAIARKDAEIAAANAEIDELVRGLKLCTQRAERAEARVREAPVAWIVGDDMFRSESEAVEEICTWGPSCSIAERVALVLLDTEEGKDG
jgi:hypothetical protein